MLLLRRKERRGWKPAWNVAQGGRRVFRGDRERRLNGNSGGKEIGTSENWLKDQEDLLPQIDRKLRVAILAALIMLGGWLRFAAIGFGLPDNFRPDEDVLVDRALGFDNDWNPRLVAGYPAAQLYLVHAVLRSYAMARGGGRDLRAVYSADSRARAYLIAREVSAAMGTATILAAYWAAELAFGPTAALASAAIVAVSSIHLRESKFAKMEVPSGLWLVLAMGMMLRIARRGRGSDYALAGFFSGLATATHYLAGIAALGILVAHLETRRRENQPLLTALVDKRVYLAGCIAALTFFCATPYFFLDLTQTVQNYEFEKWSAGGFLPSTRGWQYLLLRVLPDSLGIGLLIFLLLALIWVIFRPRLGTLALLALTAASFLILTVGDSALFYRFAVNPLLVMALLAGVLAADLIEFASRRLGARRGIMLSVALFALLLAPSLIDDLQLNRLLSQSDTRARARLWIRSHIPPLPPRTVIAATDYDPVWNRFGEPQLPAIYEFVPMQSFDLLRARRIRWVFSESLPGLVRYSPGPSAAEQKGLDSGATLVLDINPIKEGAPMPVFDQNDAFYVPFRHISSMRWPGPRIRIWMLKPKQFLWIAPK